MLNIVQTTDNFWDAFLLKLSKKPKNMRFRNGVQVEADYTQYAKLRDWFAELKAKSFTIQQAKGSYIIINKSVSSEFSFQTKSVLNARPFFDFLLSLTSLGWTVQHIDHQYRVQKGNSTCTIEQLAEDSFHIQSDKIELIGSAETMRVYFYECEAGLYDYDFTDKTVLDIGGFSGETAAYFSSKGAKKVIIYEPVTQHQSLIRKNISLNKMNAELYDEGIGEKDDIKTLNYDSLDTAFGLSNTGQKQTTIKTKNISDVLLQSGADIAKIDCEGAETSLLNVPHQILWLVDYYFIETHSREIEEAIVGKFYNSGFVMEREAVRLSKGITMLYFKRSELNSEMLTVNVGCASAAEANLCSL